MQLSFRSFLFSLVLTLFGCLLLPSPVFTQFGLSSTDTFLFTQPLTNETLISPPLPPSPSTSLSPSPSISPSSSPSPSTSPTYHVFSYYSSSSTGIQPNEIPCERMTHLLWAFANIWTDGSVVLEGPPGSNALYNALSKSYPNTTCDCAGTCLQGELYQMVLVKRRCPHLKLILSIGGWVWSSNFSVAFSTAESRKKVITTSTQLLETHGFDGLDIGTRNFENLFLFFFLI